MAMAPRPPAQALSHLSINLDQTAGIKVPALFTAELRLTGPSAAMTRMIAKSEDGKEKKEALAGLIGQYIGDAQFTSTSVEFQDEQGVGIVRASRHHDLSVG